MFYFAGNVTDEKTGKQKFILLRPDKNCWKDPNKVAFNKFSGTGLLVKRLKLNVSSVFPILYTHQGHVKYNFYDTKTAAGKKVFLVKYDCDVWITNKKEFFHCGHGLNLQVRHSEIVLGDHRKYLVLCSVEKLKRPIDFKSIEELS